MNISSCIFNFKNSSSQQLGVSNKQLPRAKGKGNCWQNRSRVLLIFITLLEMPFKLPAKKSCNFSGIVPCVQVATPLAIVITLQITAD